MAAAHPPKRLLIVVNIPRFFVTHRLPLAQAARAAGYDVHVATSAQDSENVALIKAADFPFHPLPLRQHSTNITDAIVTCYALYRLYRRLQPDIIHHITIKSILYGGVAARLARRSPVINAVPGLGYIFVTQGIKAALLRMIAKLGYRLTLRRANTWAIFQNPDDQALFIQNGLVHAGNTLLIKGSGVDMQRFRPEPESQETPLVLFGGRLMWSKGVGQFVEAARRLRMMGVGARFVIVGITEPSNPGAVAPDQLEGWQDAGVIEWWGRRDDMPQVFAQSHVVCLPSTYGEGVPKVLIEAAACGRAAVTTDIPGCREIVRHGENGLLVAKNDLDGLVAALQQLIDESSLRQAMGARGRQIAAAEFSLQRVLAETLGLYERLLAAESI